MRLRIRSRFFVEREGRNACALERPLALLRAACAEIPMSYRSAWDLLTELEAILGGAVVVRRRRYAVAGRRARGPGQCCGNTPHMLSQQRPRHSHSLSRHARCRAGFAFSAYGTWLGRVRMLVTFPNPAAPLASMPLQ